MLEQAHQAKRWSKTIPCGVCVILYYVGEAKLEQDHMHEPRRCSKMMPYVVNVFYLEHAT